MSMYGTFKTTEHFRYHMGFEWTEMVLLYRYLCVYVAVGT